MYNNDLDIKFTNLNEIIRLTEATTSYQPINLDNIILLCAELETSNNRRSNIIIPVSLLDNNTAKNFVINVYRDSLNSISVQFSLTKTRVNLFDIAPSGLQFGYFKLFGIY